MEQKIWCSIPGHISGNVTTAPALCQPALNITTTDLNKRYRDWRLVYQAAFESQKAQIVVNVPLEFE